MSRKTNHNLNSDELAVALTAFKKAIKGKVRRVKIQQFSLPASKLLKFLLLVLCLTLLSVIWQA